MNPQQIIKEIENLSQEDQQIVINYAVSLKEESFKPTDYSPDDEKFILKEAELCKKRVDTIEHASAADLCKSLGLE